MKMSPNVSEETINKVYKYTYDSNTIYATRYDSKHNLVTPISYCSVDSNDCMDLERIIKRILKFTVEDFHRQRKIQTDAQFLGIEKTSLCSSKLSNNNIIIVTDNTAKPVLIIDTKQRLKDTGLVLNDNHEIMQVERKNLKAAIHQYSLSIIPKLSTYTVVVKTPKDATEYTKTIGNEIDYSDSTPNESLILDGEYIEKLPTGGDLKISRYKWSINYYFSGPDARYKGTYKVIDGTEINKYIDAWRKNFAKYQELKQIIPIGGNSDYPGEMGMSIRFGFAEGVCLTSYNMPINTKDHLDKVIMDYEKAKVKANKIQQILNGSY